MKKAGVSVDKEDLAIFFKQIEGKDIPETVQAGQKKCCTGFPAGGARPAGAAAGGAAAAEEAPQEEEKKEEVEDVDMGGLFGDEEDEY